MFVLTVCFRYSHFLFLKCSLFSRITILRLFSFVNLLHYVLWTFSYKVLIWKRFASLVRKWVKRKLARGTEKLWLDCFLKIFCVTQAPPPFKSILSLLWAPTQFLYFCISNCNTYKCYALSKHKYFRFKLNTKHSCSQKHTHKFFYLLLLKKLYTQFNLRFFRWRHYIMFFLFNLS